ncbi:MAG: ABC transporter permease subunit [Hyphomicrobiaceae bacterium]
MVTSLALAASLPDIPHVIAGLHLGEPRLLAIRWDLLALEPPGWGGVLLRGLLQTVKIALGGYLLGLTLGLGGAMGKLYGGPVIKSLLEGYTTIVRAVPELVLILILFYAGTQALTSALASWGYGRVTINGFIAGVAVLGFVQGAYSTEVLRGAIQAIPAGQIEAARAFGMPFWLRLRRVILPAMVPFAIPGLANLWLIITKDTALLAVVSIDPSELALATRQAAGATKQYFLFLIAAFFLYLLLSLVSNAGFRAIEKHFRRGMPKLS